LGNADEVRLALRGGAVAALLWVAWRLRGTVLVLVLSAALYAVLNPVADWVSSWSRGRREVGASVALGALGGVVILGVRWTLGPLGRELSRLVGAAPAYARLAAEQLERLEASWAPLPRDVSLVRLVASAAFGAAERALTVSLSAGAHAYLALLVPVLTFFLLKDGPQLGETVLRALPEVWREPLRLAAGAAAWALRRSLLGLVCVAVVTWGLLWGGLEVLHVPNALGWSALAVVTVL